MNWWRIAAFLPVLAFLVFLVWTVGSVLRTELRYRRRERKSKRFNRWLNACVQSGDQERSREASMYLLLYLGDPYYDLDGGPWDTEAYDEPS